MLLGCDKSFAKGMTCGAGPGGCRVHQGGLESWLAGHRDRVEAKGDVVLHPVITEFRS